MATNHAEHESMYQFVWEVLKMFILAAVIILPIRIFLFQPFIVRGASMEPTFHEREYLIINEFGYKNVELFNDAIRVEPRKELSREDIVVFRSHNTRQEYYIKRVIGEPGDRVKVQDGAVTLFDEKHPDGMILDESTYLPVGRRTNGDVDYTLEEDQYFVLGDNRNASSDSRVFGPINKNDVIGKVFFRAFPFTKVNTF